MISLIDFPVTKNRDLISSYPTFYHSKENIFVVIVTPFIQVSYPSTALILVHQLTHERARNLSMNMAVQLEPIDMSIVISSMTMVATRALTDDDLARLSNVNVGKTSAAFLNCTSGSTGKPKSVEHTHGSLTYFLHCMNEALQFRPTDNVLQLASCQWTNHAWEITVSLCFGGTIVLLHPGGQLDIDYLMRTMTKKQISNITSLPSTARLLAERVASKSDESISCFHFLRVYVIGGELRDYFSFFLKRPAHI
jgi:acyl-coenzyme A synthetase/AMP-(fatty) acid ligase